MIEETIKKVIDAEKEAEEITKRALEDAKNTVSHADDEAIKVRNNAREKVKAERKQVVLQANADGDNEYSKILVAGEKECISLKQKTSTRKAVIKIADLIFERYK